MKKVLFIGGPGNISSSAITDLLGKGMEVSVFTLPGSPDDEGLAPHCQMFYGERNNTELMQSIVQQTKIDAVVDVCCFSPKQLSAAVPVINGNVEQYVFVSTCDVYGYPLSRLPMRENDEKRPPNCRYAVDKLACESLLRDEMKQTAVTVVRPAYAMSKRFALTAISRKGGLSLIPRLQKGLPVLSPNNGNGLMHASNAKDTGRMLAQTVLHQPSYGKAYTIGTQQAISYDGYLGLFADVLGVTPNIVHIPVKTIHALADYRIYEENLLNDLMAYDVQFSMEGFLHDFPHFQWKHPIQEAAADFVRFNAETGAFTQDTDPVEEGIIARFMELNR